MNKNYIFSIGLIVLSMGDVFSEIHDSFATLLGSDLLLGALIFLFFLVFTLILGLGMLVGSVVLLPAMFLVFEFVPDLKIIVAIFAGLLVGLGLHKFINR